MKKILYLVIFFMSVFAYAQIEANEDITLTQNEKDDLYLAGESITTDAQINGDLVAAGSTIIINDSIHQDLIVAGGTIKVKGYIKDDIRAAGGKLIIDTTVGDDIVVFGGDVLITDNAIINGNLIAFSGTIEMNGTVKGMMKAYGGDLKINGKIAQGTVLYTENLEINGEITGKSKIVSEEIRIGTNAKFFNDVDYYSENEKVDFKNSLKNATANFNESLAQDQPQLPWKFFGVAAVGFWIFYLLSAFLVILILNALLKNFLPKAAKSLDKDMLKSLGYGLIYLLGVPLLIFFTFIIIIGIPVGLFLLPIYIFSVIIGHLLIALLFTYYLNEKKEYNWNFWSISFIALAIAAALRLITFIPVLGFIISIIVIAIAYGLIGVALFQNRKATKITVT